MGWLARTPDHLAANPHRGPGLAWAQRTLPAIARAAAHLLEQPSINFGQLLALGGTIL